MSFNTTTFIYVRYPPVAIMIYNYLMVFQANTLVTGFYIFRIILRAANTYVCSLYFPGNRLVIGLVCYDNLSEMTTQLTVSHSFKILQYYNHTLTNYVLNMLLMFSIHEHCWQCVIE